MTEKYESYLTLLEALEGDIKFVKIDSKYNLEGYTIQPNPKKYTITREVNGNLELITLSQYKNSENLILVETAGKAFTITSWCPDFSIGEQIKRELSGLI